MNTVLEPDFRPGLWPSVWKLLRLRWTIFISAFLRAKTGRKIGMMLLGLLILGFAGFAFSMSWFLLRFLRSPQLAQIAGDVRPILESMPVMIVSGAFFGILLTSFGVLLQALYLAGDMDFLLSVPIPMRAVFITKLLQAILPNFGLFCLFSLPVLFGLGASAGYNFLYYPLVIVILAALALAAAGISALLVMGVVRIFPARRVAEIIGFLGAISSFLCSQSGQLANFKRASGSQAAETLRLIAQLNHPWSPLAWAGRGLVSLGEGNWLSGGGLLFLTLGLSITVFVLALSGAERLYYSGWASMQGVVRKKKPVRVIRQSQVTQGEGLHLARFIPSTVRALVVKDAYVLRRDLRNMSQLITPLIFGIVYAIAFFRRGPADLDLMTDSSVWVAVARSNLPLYGNVGLSLFVSWMLVSRLAGMSFSQEGRQYWIIKTAPIKTYDLLVAKFCIAFIPALLIGWLFLTFCICCLLLHRGNNGSLLPM